MIKHDKFILTNNQGFSLVELIIGMALLVIIMGAISGVLSASLRSQQYNFEQTANTQEERHIISAISSEIRNTILVNSPNPNDTSTSFSYRRAGDVADRTIAIGTGSDANTIVIKNGTTVIQRLGIGRVQRLEFTRGAAGATARRIEIVLSLRNTTRPNDQPVTTSVYTLN